ncbi:MAG: mechanosensitive ion channel family protein [Anaerolineae bacterium]|nr:MAG: mechanosensitive ion channel family protein [Anaerolineae bacterium]
METYLNDWIAKLLAFLPNLLTAVLILVASIWLARLLGNALIRVLKRRNADPEVTLLLAQITRWGIIAAGVITALQRFFDVTAFLAGLGIMGFTIGFALQDIMQNFVAGTILLIQQPFNVGDAIEVAGYGGTVLAINLRTTEMRTWDGRVVIIPNAEVLSNVITNYTRAERRRIKVPVGVAYDADLDAAREAILEAIRTVPGYLPEPAPVVVSDTFGDSAINLTTYFWIDTSKTGLFDATDTAVRAIKAELDRRGIDIPFPIRTVYLHSQT